MPISLTTSGKESKVIDFAAQFSSLYQRWHERQITLEPTTKSIEHQLENVYDYLYDDEMDVTEGTVDDITVILFSAPAININNNNILLKNSSLMYSDYAFSRDDKTTADKIINEYVRQRKLIHFNYPKEFFNGLFSNYLIENSSTFMTHSGKQVAKPIAYSIQAIMPSLLNPGPLSEIVSLTSQATVSQIKSLSELYSFMPLTAQVKEQVKKEIETTPKTNKVANEFNTLFDWLLLLLITASLSN